MSLFLHTSDWAMPAVSRAHIVRTGSDLAIFAPLNARQAVSRLVALPHLSGQKIQGKIWRSHLWQVLESRMILTFLKYIFPIYCHWFPVLIPLWEIALQLFVGGLSKSLPMIHQLAVHNCLQIQIRIQMQIRVQIQTQI